MAKAWPHETIGIIKFSIGGTSLLAWKPDWSKEDANRVGQGRHGPLYKQLMEKVEAAKQSRDIEKHPANVHYNTAGQLTAGELFAEALLGKAAQHSVRLTPPNCPACAMGLTAEFVFDRLDVDEDNAVTVKEFRKSPGMQDEAAASEAVGRIDQDADGSLAWEEFKAAYKARHANCKPSKPIEGMRHGDRGNATMFSQVFMLRNDKNGDGKVDKSEFRGAEMGFNRLDQNKNGFIDADELGELHQSRMNDPKSMRERLESGDVRKPPKGKGPESSSRKLDVGR